MAVNSKLHFDQDVWQADFLYSMERSPSKEEIEDELGKTVELEEKVLTSIETVFKEQVSFYCPIHVLNVLKFQKTLSIHHVNKVTKTILKLFQEKIKELDGLKNICLAYTGSDGREEKLSSLSSPIELMFIVRHKEELESGTLGKILAFVDQHSTLFYGKVEVKCLETDSLICFNRNWNWKETKDYRSFPTRALDARYLIGDKSILKEYKIQFYKEVQDPKSAKLLKGFRKDALQPTLSLLKRTCDQKALSDIDLTKSLAFYNGERIKGTKYPFLRSMQYKLGFHACMQIQQNKMSMEDFLEMPYSTVERVQWLAAKKLLNMDKSQVEAFQKSYAASLIWFGITQKNYEVHGQSQTLLPQKDLNDVAKIIVNICQDKKIFPL